METIPPLSPTVIGISPAGLEEVWTIALAEFRISSASDPVRFEVAISQERKADSPSCLCSWEVAKEFIENPCPRGLLGPASELAATSRGVSSPS